MKKFLLLFLTLSLVIATTANAAANAKLKGTVTFAPLCPSTVTNCTTAPNYTGRYVELCRKIYGHLEAGSKGQLHLVCDESKLIIVPLNSKGNYSVSLPTSTDYYNYYIDFPLQGVESSDNVPVLITHLSPGETRVFNINVDTGLR